MSTDIYYFSGTGNSLHVARELRERLDGATLQPIVRLLRNDVIRTNADTVGFVFPNFCLTVPIPMHEFLKKIDLASAQYIFAVCTRGGTPSEAFDYIDAKLRKQGRKLNAQLNINMPWNHPLGKENLPGTVTGERIDRLESVMQGDLDLFSGFVAAGKDFAEPDRDATYVLPQWVKAFSSLVPKSLNYGSHDYMYQRLVCFFSDAKCNGCGVCERVCLNRRVEMVDNRPAWRGDVRCYACFACINYCPQQAIQIASRPPFFRSYTDVNARYHHASISYRDIAEQR